MTVAPELIEKIRAAVASRDPAVFAPLLAADVRWGDDGHPRRCRGREDVIATLSRGLAEGVEVCGAEVVVGSDGVVCALSLAWPDGPAPRRPRRLFHVYKVRDGLISEILAFGDRRSALAAARRQA